MPAAVLVKPVPGDLAALLHLVRTLWPELLGVALLTLLATSLRLLGVRQVGALYGGGAAFKLQPLAKLLSLRLAEGVAKALQTWAWARAAARIEARLMSNAFEALMRTDLAELERAHLGSLASSIAADAAEVSRALETLAFKGVRNVTTVCAGAWALAGTSWQIAGLASVLVPPATVLFIVVGRWGARLARRAAERAQAAASFAAERVAAIRTIRLNAQETVECRRYASHLALARSARDKHAAVHALHVGLLTSLPGMGMGLFLAAASELVSRGSLTVASQTTLVPIVMEIAGALGGLSRLHASVTHGADAATRLRELAALPGSIERSVGVTPPGVRGGVSFRNVTFAYPSRAATPVLRGLDLDLRPGETFALVGQSGSGKSTLAALLCRLYDVDSGSIMLDGADIRTLDPRALRRAIGVVSQDSVLFSGTIRDNLAYGFPEAPLTAVRAAATSAHAHDFIARLPHGYATSVGERGSQLSGGQRQRIAIARVLLSDPQLVLLDEATSALDNESEKLVTAAFASVLQGRTCLIIAHRMSTIERADRIGVMEHGRIVEVGTHAELLARRGSYWRLLNSAAFAEEHDEKS